MYETLRVFLAKENRVYYILANRCDTYERLLLASHSRRAEKYLFAEFAQLYTPLWRQQLSN